MMQRKKVVTIAPVHPDMHDHRVPAALFWSPQQVAEWLDKNGYGRYCECFLSNNIDGRRLIYVDASHLPAIGVTDWLHVKGITKLVRELMTIEDPDWHRSISLPPREEISMYEEIKSQKGAEADALTFEEFKAQTKDRVWQPPLGNIGVLLSTALRPKPPLSNKAVSIASPSTNQYH